MGAGVLLLAAGSGTRLGGDTAKAHTMVAGRPLLAYSLATFAAAPSISHVVVVDRPADREVSAAIAAAHGDGKVVAIVAGGDHRQASEIAGLAALESWVVAGEVDVVAVHDAARPLVTVDLVERLVGAARRHGGAVPGLAVAGPVVTVVGGAVRRARAGSLVRMQTPQAFAAGPFLAAYRAAGDVPAVDTAQVMERHSEVVIAVEPGDESNLKVTYPADLATCERLLRSVFP